MSTVIRTLVGVYTIVSLQIRLSIEALIGYSQPYDEAVPTGQGDGAKGLTHTFGQSSHEHSNGRAEGLPAEASRSETAAFAIEKTIEDDVVVHDRVVYEAVLLGAFCLAGDGTESDWRRGIGR